VRGARANGLMAAGLTACALGSAFRALDAAPDPHLVARWWPATALITVLFLLLPRQDTRGLTFLTTAGMFAVAVMVGHQELFAVTFAVANTAEVLVVVWWLTRLEEGVPSLRSWGDYRRLLLGITVGCLVSGMITSAGLWATEGVSPWRTLLWIFFTHSGAQAVVLPLVLRQPRHRVQVSPIEILVHCLLLGTAVSACVLADPGQPVAFLLMPVLMWSAARFTPRWANVELLGVSLAVVLISISGYGPFAEVTSRAPFLTIAASAQVFVLICAITAVAFSVATSHLRDSLRRIRENELQLHQLLDSASGTAFIATDREGVITLFSPGAEQLLGHTAAELVGLVTPLPFHDSRELSARARELGIPATRYDVVTRPLELGEEQDTRDWTYIRKDGSRIMVSLSVTAVRRDDGQPLSYLSVVRDVTDRRAAEQALRGALEKEREANRRMHAVDRAKDDFVSTVSHELRTPLTSIIGYTELLEDGLSGPLTAMQQSLVEKIDRNGSRLLSLVEDLLTLSRVANGSFQLERVPTDLGAAVRRATAEVATTAEQQQVSVEVQLPAEPVTVVGDSEHLERLVLNLVSNAVKFSDSGSVVRVHLRRSQHLAVLAVSDTGIGIPLEEQPNLFQRFFRTTIATEKAIQGTGLGLNIVRSIAEAHDGAIDFESTPGVGTTFWFRIPVKSPVEVTETPEAPTQRDALAAPALHVALEASHPIS
jgi:PAS domain S-box-containing protein